MSSAITKLPREVLDFIIQRVAFIQQDRIRAEGTTAVVNFTREIDPYDLASYAQRESNLCLSRASEYLPSSLLAFGLTCRAIYDLVPKRKQWAMLVHDKGAFETQDPQGVYDGQGSPAPHETFVLARRAISALTACPSGGADHGLGCTMLRKSLASAAALVSLSCFVDGKSTCVASILRGAAQGPQQWRELEFLDLQGADADFCAALSECKELRTLHVHMKTEKSFDKRPRSYADEMRVLRALPSLVELRHLKLKHFNFLQASGDREDEQVAFAGLAPPPKLERLDFYFVSLDLKSLVHYISPASETLQFMAVAYDQGPPWVMPPHPDAPGQKELAAAPEVTFPRLRVISFVTIDTFEEPDSVKELEKDEMMRLALRSPNLNYFLYEEIVDMPYDAAERQAQLELLKTLFATTKLDVLRMYIHGADESEEYGALAMQKEDKDGMSLCDFNVQYGQFDAAMMAY